MLTEKVMKIINDNGGIKNFRCFALNKKLNDRMDHTSWTWCECYITNTPDIYSESCDIITLASKCSHDGYERYSERDYTYQGFLYAIESGSIVIKNSDKQHIDKIRCIQPLCGDAYLVHEADVIVS